MLIDRFREELSSLIGRSSLSDKGGAYPKIIVAVSGGVDSMCMAHLFSRTYPGSFAIATVNFSLRGEESDGDAAMVRIWAEQQGIDFYEKRFDTAEYAAHNRCSTQIAARELRYKWFEDLAKKYAFEYVAIAHNLNDSIETLFINLIRGTGIDGLSGIRRRSGEWIIRPLISFSRTEIEEYMDLNSVPYRVDHTNLENHYTRNKIRNLIIPLFEEINPSFLKVMERNIGLFAEIGEIIDTTSEEKGLVLWSGGRGSIAIDKILQEPHSLFWLYYSLRVYGYNFDQVVNIIEAIKVSKVGAIFYSATHRLLIDRGNIFIEPSLSLGEALDAEPFVIPDCRDVKFDFLGLAISLSFFERGVDFSHVATDNTQYLDVETISFPLICRAWRSGDRFIPLGMDGYKKLSDFYTDLKIDRLSKRREPVLIDSEGRIVSLLNRRIDNRFRVTERSHRLLKISVSYL